MDVRDLQLPDASVDVAIDKGTLDAMFYGSPYDPPDDVRINLAKYVDEVGCTFLHHTASLMRCTGRKSLEARRRVALHHLSSTALHEAATVTRT